MNVNFHVSRYTFLIVLLAALFVLLVVKAFTYLPEEQNDTLLLQNAKHKLVGSEANDAKEEAPEITFDQKSEKESFDDPTDKLFAEAELYADNGDYSKALSKYLEIVNIVDEPQKYAVCYDGISKIYREQKKYDKAIEKAILAYKYEPNDARKLTLARLYHKTGDMVNEQNMLSELLENDEQD